MTLISIDGFSASPTVEPLVKKYIALGKNKKAAELRQSWEELEKQFIILANKSSGTAKVEASYYAVRCVQSLAQRSHNKNDYTKAAIGYKDFVERFPTSSNTPDALLQISRINYYRTKNTQEAVKYAQQLISQFPKSAEAKEAKELLKKQSAAPKDTTLKQSTTATQQRTSAKNTSRAEQLGLTVKTVMIDAGHGGRDPGAEANGIRERTHVLKVARLLGATLQKEGFTVLYTRTDNKFIALEKRAILANEQRADLFISIHVNANNDKNVNGLETYYLDAARSNSAARVAARENAVSVSQVSDVQFIVADLMLNTKLKESKTLGEQVQRSILRELKKGKITYKDNGVRSAPFYVLMGARMPAILVELGYITNARESKLLKSDAFLQRQVTGIVQGVIAYKKLVAQGIEQ